MRAMETSTKSRLLNTGVAAGMVGLATTVTGLAWDATTHAADPGLAAREGTFFTAAPPHVLIGLGLTTTGIGLVVACWALLARAHLVIASVIATTAVVASLGAGALALSADNHSHDEG